MIDDALIDGIAKIANKRIEKDFPLLGDKYFKSSEVRYIVEAVASLCLVWEHHKRKEKNK
jgi:hypothetical protein